MIARAFGLAVLGLACVAFTAGTAGEKGEKKKTGKKDAAFVELEKAARLPGYLNYGELKLDSVWDPIRSDPRFQKIIASLAPK